MALITQPSPSSHLELGRPSALTPRAGEPDLLRRLGLEPDGSPSASGPAEASPGETPRLLGRGHAGDDVRELQQKLRDAGMTLRVDGIFGPETEEAVKAFQAKATSESGEPLVQDGLAGPKTMKALSESGAARSAERGREFTEQAAPKVTTPASELPGTAMSAREVVQALQSNANPQQVLSGGLPGTNLGNTPGGTVDKSVDQAENALLAATGVVAAGAGAVALARRPADFKGVVGGDHVHTAAQKLQAEANRTGRAQKFEFNGKSGATLVARPGDSVEKILEPFARKEKVDVSTLVKEGKADAFRASHGGHGERAVDQAFRRGVNEHLLKETGNKSIQLKPGQTLASLEGKITGNVLKGAREAGDAAVEQLKATPPKSSTPRASPTPSVDATYRKAVNAHLFEETGKKSIQLRPGQTLASLEGKVTGNVLKGAREAGDAAVEAMPKPVAKATAKGTEAAIAKSTEAAVAKGAAKAPTSMLRIGGRALVVGAAAMDAVELASAHQADKTRGDGKSTEVKATATSIGLSWGGAIAGAKVGAAAAAKFGLIAGPKGAAVAGVLGGLIGAGVGVFAGDAAGDAIRAADAGS